MLIFTYSTPMFRKVQQLNSFFRSEAFTKLFSLLPFRPVQTIPLAAGWKVKLWPLKCQFLLKYFPKHIIFRGKHFYEIEISYEYKLDAIRPVS